MDTSTKNQTLVYRFVDVDPEEGLDAKDLSKFLSQFDGLIKEVAKESGTLENTSIKVRPFKEGSFYYGIRDPLCARIGWRVKQWRYICN